MQHVTWDAWQATWQRVFGTQRARGSQVSAFVACVHEFIRHRNVNTATPSTNNITILWVSGRQCGSAERHNASIQNSAFHSKHMVIVYSMWELRSCDILCASLSFSLYSLRMSFFYPRCYTSVYNCSEYAPWFQHIHWADCRLRCTRRAYASPMKINNFVQFKINVQYSVEHWLPVSRDVPGLCARRLQKTFNSFLNRGKAFQQSEYRASAYTH